VRVPSVETAQEDEELELPLPAPRPQKSPQKKTRTSKSKSQSSVARQWEANRFGISMVAIGAICLLLPLFGLQLRRAGAATPIVGVILLIVGGASWFVSHSRRATDASVSIAKLFLWLVIGALVLVALLAVVGLIYGLVVANRG
jgi:hypothetical protein